LEKANEKYKEVSGGVEERTRTLNMLTDELEALKQQMEERGASMTDGSKI
jgi:intraflagellar transport protein 57